MKIKKRLAPKIRSRLISAIGIKGTFQSRSRMSTFGGKAERPFAGIRFRGRYWGQSGHALLHCICPLITQSGHQRGLIARRLIAQPASRTAHRDTVMDDSTLRR